MWVQLHFNRERKERLKSDQSGKTKPVERMDSENQLEA
jgi:hypothetical protein